MTLLITSTAIIMIYSGSAHAWLCVLVNQHFKSYIKYVVQKCSFFDCLFLLAVNVSFRVLNHISGVYSYPLWITSPLSSFHSTVWLWEMPEADHTGLSKRKPGSEPLAHLLPVIRSSTKRSHYRAPCRSLVPPLFLVISTPLFLSFVVMNRVSSFLLSETRKSLLTAIARTQFSKNPPSHPLFVVRHPPALLTRVVTYERFHGAHCRRRYDSSSINGHRVLTIGTLSVAPTQEPDHQQR